MLLKLDRSFTEFGTIKLDVTRCKVKLIWLLKIWSAPLISIPICVKSWQKMNRI